MEKYNLKANTTGSSTAGKQAGISKYQSSILRVHCTFYFSLSSFALSKIDTSMSWAIQNKPQQEQLCLHRVGQVRKAAWEKKKAASRFLRDYIAPAFILLLSYFGAKKAAREVFALLSKSFSPERLRQSQGCNALCRLRFPLPVSRFNRISNRYVKRAKPALYSENMTKKAQL